MNCVSSETVAEAMAVFVKMYQDSTIVLLVVGYLLGASDKLLALVFAGYRRLRLLARLRRRGAA
ncbi:MAG: hypothetical protein H6R10_609 [Rhodocyclaceae bacterium]|nr:hypothetical protein [Rhodocyclaceae bacterium]